MKLYQRSDKPGAPWHARFQVKGRTYWWSTKTDDKALARKRAKHYRDAVVDQKHGLLGQMQSRGAFPPFRVLFAEYLDLPSPAEGTRRENVSAMKAVLAASGYNEGAGLDRLGSDLAGEWQRKATADGIGVIGINGKLRKARSLFSKRAMMLYRVAVPVEGVASFFKVPMLREPDARPELPTPEADRLAHERLPAFPDVWRAFLLGRYGGLRAGEQKAARTDWLDGNRLHVGGRPDQFQTKSRRWRTVVLPDAVAAELAKAPGPFIVGKTPRQTVYRTLNAKLRECGFFVKKPNQSLRRLFGSSVYTEQGPRQARDALGHSTQAVTDKSYARSLDAPAAIAFCG